MHYCKLLPTLLLLVPAFSINAQEDLKKGLVASYSFNGNANDESGEGHHAVEINATLTEDRFGNKDNAYFFNGKDSRIRVKSSSLLSPTELTLAAVIKPMGFYQGLCYNNSIIDKGKKDYLPGCYSLRFTAGEYTRGRCDENDTTHQNFVGMTAANGGVTSQEIYVETGTWYYVTFTISKDNTRIFINGEMITAKASTGKVGKNNDDLFFGFKDHPQYPYWFNGVIDEIRIYNRALSYTEVTELYETLSKK